MKNIGKLKCKVFKVIFIFQEEFRDKIVLDSVN